MVALAAGDMGELGLQSARALLGIVELAGCLKGDLGIGQT